MLLGMVSWCQWCWRQTFDANRMVVLPVGILSYVVPGPLLEESHDNIGETIIPATCSWWTLEHPHFISWGLCLWYMFVGLLQLQQHVICVLTLSQPPGLSDWYMIYIYIYNVYIYIIYIYINRGWYHNCPSLLVNFPIFVSSSGGLTAAARSCGWKDPQPDGYADAAGARLWWMQGAKMVELPWKMGRMEKR